MSEPNRRLPPNVPRSSSPIMVVRRDGRVEPFNRAKMIESMRNAGATPQQANIATNRVATRLAPGTTVQSNEVSRMVTQSLSQVNPTASKHYATTNEQKTAYTQRVNSLSYEISGVNQQVNSLTGRVENLNNKIQSLPGRISKIRQGKYRFLTHLETDQVAVSQEWSTISPGLRSTANMKGENVRQQAQILQQRLSSKAGMGDYNVANLQDIEAGLPQLRSSLSEMHNAIDTSISPTEQKFDNLNQELAQVENTLSIMQGASFPWEEDETPVAAIKAKELNNDQEGFLTLTNLKFVFEHQKEIVLKKTLFIVTEKKVVREVKVQKPIGMVTDLTKGKVGFFKGTGLYIKFASESGIPEMKFDTSSQDAEWVTKNYNYIISGEAEKDLAATTPATANKTEKESMQLVTCKICGAPYTEKIYRGQTSVNCKYCGAAISIQ